MRCRVSAGACAESSSLHGSRLLVTGIGYINKTATRCAPAITTVYTAGGGAKNPAWERIRERILQVEMEKARSGHAAYGSALLAAGIVTKTFQ